MAQRYAVLDFDGTVSTLRCGWEQIMAKLMLETLSPDGTRTPEQTQQVLTFIEQSTGTATILQMEWLAQQLRQRTGESQSAQVYKDQYNCRLMEMVDQKRQALQTGEHQPSDHMVSGAPAFLRRLKDLGWHLVLASGTDEDDVKLEAELLGIAPLFDGISGAPRTKEQVLQALITQAPQAQIVVIGDGTAEISLAGRYGFTAIGIASDEIRRQGIDPQKKIRLEQAGADVIFGDFTQPDKLLAAMEGKA